MSHSKEHFTEFASLSGSPAAQLPVNLLSQIITGLTGDKV